MVTTHAHLFSFHVRLDLLLGLCRVPLRKCGSFDGSGEKGRIYWAASRQGESVFVLPVKGNQPRRIT